MDDSGSDGSEFLASLARPLSSLLPQPGLRRRLPGRELYRVPAGGSLVLALAAGDRLTLQDPEGAQPGTLTAFSLDGRPAQAELGARDDGPASALQAALTDGSTAAASSLGRLERRGIEVSAARAQTVFGRDGAPGAEAQFTASEALIVVLAAPGQDMTPETQRPPTDLEACVERANPVAVNDLPLPDPLADPRLDLRVEARTAAAYEVRAGDYIQVIDVAGRECSDFGCFASAALERGKEFMPDMIATRSIMGLQYPLPGLFDKYYDFNAQAMLEVIQDRVGRHDTFGAACTDRYYDDVGYPGHANCSANFNRALAPYGVAARRAWATINFFYNTAIDDSHLYTLDEPWSRPGDFVLLRATQDLVCCSSACPDDISPANGWTPTDIHIRVYGPEQLHKKSMAYRMTPDAAPRETRETGFHPRTSQLTRQFGEYRGFWLPNRFHNEGPQAEYWACREDAVVLDLSALRKFEVLGPDAETLMQTALTRNVRKLSEGQVVYSAMCYENGGMVDDGTLFRMGPDAFRWICGDDYCGPWLRKLARELDLKVWVKSATDQLHNLSVQGPKSRDILAGAIWTPDTRPSLTEIGWFRFTVGRIGDHNGPPVVVSRTGYTGELGYEIWCHPRDAVAVWDAVTEAGGPQGIKPLGLTALDILRIESGLIFYGYEFDEQTDPFEAGIGFTVPLTSKQEDFLGREALIRRKEHPQRQLVGLEIAGNEAVGHGDCIHSGRPQIGAVTSATRSPILRKNIALARLDAAYVAPGTEVEIGKLDGHQKRIPAKVVPFPFYDPRKERPRS
ncbi:MAG: DUF1989 domain-containing protein [Rhodospirillales bacterium]|nr:DUF1989 domain-containing protein [Rhodospirillales bacterium]